MANNKNKMLSKKKKKEWKRRMMKHRIKYLIIRRMRTKMVMNRKNKKDLINVKVRMIKKNKNR